MSSRLKRKRDSPLPNASSPDSPKSSIASSPRPMDKWLKRSDFYEPHYLGFLDEIISGVYTNIGRKYDNAFWEEFTVEFNRRIEVAIADADPPIEFEHFSVVEVVDAGLLLRQKYKDYKGINPQNVPNLNLLELCFKTCDRCLSVPKFPTSLKSNKSSVSSRANFRGGGSSCGGSSRGRSTSKVSVTTPEGKKAVAIVARLFKSGDLTPEDVDKAMYYFDICVSKCYFFLKLKEECRVRFIKEIQRRDH